MSNGKHYVIPPAPQAALAVERLGDVLAAKAKELPR